MCYRTSFAKERNPTAALFMLDDGLDKEVTVIKTWLGYVADKSVTHPEMQ